MTVRTSNRIIATTFFAIISSPSVADQSAALQLVQEAFKCKTAVSGNATARSMSELIYKGDFNKFVLSAEVTRSQETPVERTYNAVSGTYTSFVSLLKFNNEGASLSIVCQKPACLSHSWVSTGCDANGICSNVGANSVEKEYVNSVRVELCNSSAAKDAADGLN